MMESKDLTLYYISGCLCGTLYFVVIMFCLADLHGKVDKLDKKIDLYNQAVAANNKNVDAVILKAGKWLD